MQADDDSRPDGADAAARAGGAKTPQGSQSRERILQAALELIGERGYSATSVDALCKRAGIMKTALYWHFGSKEGLLAALLERVSQDWTDEIERRVGAEGPPLARLDHALASLRELVEQRPRHLRLVLSVLLERGESDPQTRDTVRRIYDRLSASIVQTFEDTIGQPLPDLDLVAHALLSLQQAAALRYLADPERADLERFFSFTRRTVILLIVDRMREAGLVPPDAIAGGN
ncbi:MAG TPA: TetR/AcrR family transcriptional regulator [Myxococcota bacterium]|jgi:AcrR family transcriptional regulator|nr:TetR/AcrR family transcriptional regulator [Myxococcota bacterium]